MYTQTFMCIQIKVAWDGFMLDTITCKQTHVYELKSLCVESTQNIIQPISPIFLKMLAKMDIPFEF